MSHQPPCPCPECVPMPKQDREYREAVGRKPAPAEAPKACLPDCYVGAGGSILHAPKCKPAPAEAPKAGTKPSWCKYPACECDVTGGVCPAPAPVEKAGVDGHVHQWRERCDCGAGWEVRRMELAKQVLEFQRNDKRSEAEKIEAGVAFVMGPDYIPSVLALRAELAQAKEEIDRYKAALEQLAKHSFPGTITRDVAMAALTPEPASR